MIGMKLAGKVREIDPVIKLILDTIPKDRLMSQIIIDCNDCTLCRVDQNMSNPVRLSECSYEHDYNLPSMMISDFDSEESLILISEKYKQIHDRHELGL